LLFQLGLTGFATRNVGGRTIPAVSQPAASGISKAGQTALNIGGRITGAAGRGARLVGSGLSKAGGAILNNPIKSSLLFAGGATGLGLFARITGQDGGGVAESNAPGGDGGFIDGSGDPGFFGNLGNIGEGIIDAGRGVGDTIGGLGEALGGVGGVLGDIGGAIGPASDGESSLLPLLVIGGVAFFAFKGDSKKSSSSKKKGARKKNAR